MVSKKILGVAIAAAFSSQAFAVIDTTTSPMTGVVVAKESVLNTTAQFSDGTTPAGVPAGMVVLTNAGAATNVNVKFKAGSGVASGGHAYIRVNLTNAVFASAAPVLTTSGTAFTAQNVMQGGAAGGAYAIFDVTSAGITQADVFTLPLTTLAVSPSSSVTVAATMYDSPSAAVNQTAANILSTVSFSSAVSVANALTTTITKTDRIADVSAATPFTKFVSSTTATETLGNVKFTLAAGAVDATGAAVTLLTQVMDTAAGKSKFVVTGDLGFTVGASAAATAANLKFNAVNSNTAATNVPSAKLDDLSGQALGGAGNDVSVTAVTAMNVNDYSLTFTPTAITNAQYGAATTSGALGSISRSGTTIQVPYVTTFADYNQRLVLVNRGSTAAPYSITFTPETGVTAAAGTAATGSLAAGKTVVLKASDVVTLTGGSRTAATVVVTAPTSTIDAATTTVNLSDKSTDTVKLQ